MKELLIPLIRGYKKDDYGSGKLLKNEYLILCKKRARRFLNDFNPDIFDRKFKYDEIMDGDSVNFWFPVFTKESYWNKYLKLKNPISPHYPLPEWFGRSIIAFSENEIGGLVKKVIHNFDECVTNGEPTDIFFRLHTFFPNYLPKPMLVKKRKFIYTSGYVPLGKNKLDITYRIVDISIEHIPRYFLKGVVKCEALFKDDEGMKKIEFDILAFSPYVVYSSEELHQEIFPPHIAVEGKGIRPEKLKEYVLYCLSYFQASTEQELLMKLCAITESIDSKKLLKREWKSEIKYKFKFDYISTI